MDYKILFEQSFENKIDQINSEVISQVVNAKKRNKNFLRLSEQIKKDLKNKAILVIKELFEKFPDLCKSFQNRHEEYESDHLNSFLTYDFPDFSKKYIEKDLKNCANQLGVYEAYSMAEYHFSNSYKFLELAYDLNKHYKSYSLKFGPNDRQNPIQSDLFFQMQRERFPANEVDPYMEEAFKEFEKMKKKVELNPEVKQASPEKALEGSNIPILGKEEKLLLTHYLIQSTKLPTIERVKILVIIGIPPIDVTIFTEKSRDNKFYNIILKGANYFGEKNGKVYLNSLLRSIEHFKLNSLNRAIRMDLNKS